MGKLYVGDIGKVVNVYCKSVITEITGIALEIRKPDGTEVSWDASIYGTKYVRSVTQEGDLDQAGTYRLQISFTLGECSGLSETGLFEVYAPFA